MFWAIRNPIPVKVVAAGGGIPFLTISGIVVAALVGVFAAYLGGRMARQATRAALERELRISAIADFAETMTMVMTTFFVSMNSDVDSSNGERVRQEFRAAQFKLTAQGLRLSLLGLEALESEIEVGKRAVNLVVNQTPEIQKVIAEADQIPKEDEKARSAAFDRVYELAQPVTKLLGGAVAIFNSSAKELMASDRLPKGSRRSKEEQDKLDEILSRDEDGSESETMPEESADSQV